MNQKFETDAPNKVWLSDSTKLRFGPNGEHKIRLSGVLDLYGRFLLAHHLSVTETSSAKIEVFQRAFDSTGNVNPLIHTDRGSAYPSDAFNNFLGRYDVTRSMSRLGTPCDNAPNGTLVK